MNILIVVDKPTSAIDRLAQGVAAHNKHLNIKVVAVHPKRPSTELLSQLPNLIEWADVLDVHYWKSGEVIRTNFPESFANVKKLVCHFNPYDLDKENWNEIYDDVVVGNESMRNELAYARLVPYMVDLDTFKYIEGYDINRRVLMVASRIESKKGILPVAQACKAAGLRFALVGRISNQEYFDSIIKANPDIQFYENVNDNCLVEQYKKAVVLVCNSVDGFESGTLPILEAMACGVPVVTRRVGHVPDLEDGKNMIINKSEPEDVKALEKLLKDFVDNLEWREKVRQAGWKTVKNRPIEKMARMFYRIYMRLMLEDSRPIASVIIPTKDNPDAFIKCLAHAVVQTYQNTEIVVVDSGEKPVNYLVDQYRIRSQIPIKYVRFEDDGYTLPKARNLGVLEADGEILVFCDDRIGMGSDAVETFVQESRPRTWLYGIKDGVEKPFVENFSSVMRSELLRLGGFNERVDGYGGASQELRTRFHDKNAFDMRMIKVYADSLGKSKQRNKKREQTWKQKFNLWKMYG